MVDNKETDDLDDEFADDAADADLADDSWDEGDYESSDIEDDKGADSGAPGKKKSSTLIIAVGAVAVVGLLFVFMGANGGGNQPAMEAQPESVAAEGQPPAETAMQEIKGFAPASPDEEPAPVVEPPKQPEAPKSGMLNNPQELQKIEAIHEDSEFEEYADDTGEEAAPGAAKEGQQQAAAFPPMPAATQPVDVTETLQAVPDQPPPQPSLPQDQQTLLSPQSDSVAPPAIPAPAMPMANDIPVMGSSPKAQDTVEAPSSIGAASLDQDAMKELQQSLGMIGEKLEVLNSRLEILESKDDGMKQVKESIAALEQKIAGLSVQKTAPVAVKLKTSVKSDSASAAPVKKAVSTSKKDVIARHDWVLKSAQPGRAIVSKPGSSEVYTVSVGENLAGIGRISAIERQNGMWVVQGANGQITQ